MPARLLRTFIVPLLSMTLFSGCIHFFRSSSPSIYPRHGNEYYNKKDAKYIGCDSALASVKCRYCLIDSVTYAKIRGLRNITDEAIADRLQQESTKIMIYDSMIQAQLQQLRDTTLLDSNEYQLYIYLDRLSGILSCVWDKEKGNNHESWPEVMTAQKDSGIVCPPPLPDSNGKRDNRILIAQAHSHPATKNPNEVTERDMSPADKNVAFRLQMAIYAVDAMNGAKREPDTIWRAEPEHGRRKKIRVNSVGITMGHNSRQPTFNIGLDALKIWSGSGHPDTKYLDSLAKGQHNTRGKPR